MSQPDWETQVELDKVMNTAVYEIRGECTTLAGMQQWESKKC